VVLPNYRRARHPLVARLPKPVQAVARSAYVRYRHRGIADIDLLTVAYPKSGSTWLRFLLASAFAGRSMDFDVVSEFSPPVGYHRKAPQLLPGGGRIIKSHEPYRAVVLGGRPRVLYLVRDGRDVAISYFHYLKRRGAPWEDLDEFIDPFLAGRVAPYGPWQTHVAAWLTQIQRRPEHGMVVRYEDMLADTLGTMLAVNDHFDLGADKERLARAVEGSSVERMRQAEQVSVRFGGATAASPLVRAAQSDQWRSVFSPAAAAKFEQQAREALDLAGYPHGS
jgi:hypothetical protein